jgi:hypothetical protein
MMDHLKEAKEQAEFANDFSDRGHNVTAEHCRQIALVHAAIALVERLDQIITLDADGKSRWLRVDTGEV